jgi:hypothetical protein
MKRVTLLTAALAVAASFSATVIQAQTCKPVSKKHHAKKGEVSCQDLQEQLNKMQAQIDALKNQIQPAVAATPVPETDPVALPVAQAAQSTANSAKATADSASATAASAQTTAQAADTKATDAESKVDKLHDEVYSPAALHYKGITITPGGFVAAEGVYRQHTVNSDINTPFNSIPIPSANEGHTSELNFSGRQSRLSVLAQANPGTTKLTGYYEMDFLGTGTSSNNNQSNSYVLRQRQIWGKVETAGGFAMTGGQMWSLVTEDRKGTDTRTEIQPQTIDPQYLVGYSWTRQPGFRFQQRFGDLTKQAFTVAASVEQSQITGFNVASSVSAAIPNQYFFGGFGQNGGLYNAASTSTTAACTSTSTTTPVTITCTNTISNLTTYANNVVPDVIVKAAFDLPLFHIEVGGLGRFLRDYYLPITASGGTAAAPTYTYASTYSTNTKSAGGVFGSARVYLAQKKVEVAVQAMAGQGVGRYGSSQLADATLRPDETLEPIRNYHGLYSTEIHVTPKFDVFFYGGDEYAQRTTYTTAQGDTIGYGARQLNDSGCYSNPAAPSTTQGAGTGGTLSPVTCASPTRNIFEAMGGIQWRPISSPKYGRLQYSATYSYIQRNLWSGTSTNLTNDPTGPRATEPMVHVQMRYFIP